ncbi:MAG: aconitate hydratase AcnA [Planctomycetes bacterium]|jgi:aconitate hydratase|nr:aconitate hydratase AcnA [Planctomycetota bacterium]MDP6409551.1 aconitate hydratase AcnA [Planctomycetota bacterium]
MNSFDSRAPLEVGGTTYTIHRLAALGERGHDLARLPYALRILLENLLRTEDGVAVEAADIEALASWDPAAVPSREIAFTPGRVLLQDFTGVPAVVDLAAMRDAVAAMGGDPSKINPLQPVELVIDHSVQVDRFGSASAREENARIEYERNGERYTFLRWGQTAFENFSVVPPETGIVHQVNLEYLARVVMDAPDAGGAPLAYPDTLVGTDSHTTMINGLGVLGWGVGGIEAEAAMLGQPVSMLIPQVVGVRLVGELPGGATATDLVLRIVEVLRAHGVVGKFVEFTGPGLAALTLASRATIANMAPEYGATCGIFPIDEKVIDYLRLSGRSEQRTALVEAYAREQGLFCGADSPEASYTDVLELDLGSITPCIAGPKRPQDRVPLEQASAGFARSATEIRAAATLEAGGPQTVAADRGDYELDDGSVVIAAITSCTNTSNPSVLVAAGLLAKKAVERGLSSKPWVKTSLAPGSRVVTEYLEDAGLLEPLGDLGFHVVGYGCTTCIGNSGPLPEEVGAAIDRGGLVACSVLSGNRNFEGRVHAKVRANYLASPPLVVAYALAGSLGVDLTEEPIGTGSDGQSVFLADLWPSAAEIEAVVSTGVRAQMYRESYEDVLAGSEAWRALAVPVGDTYAWDPASTYVKLPPFFQDMPAEPGGVADVLGARALCLLGDSITTDHISPAGAIAAGSPAAAYLTDNGVAAGDFNSYGSRRGNHEVMMRGTFANVRLRNRLAPGTEGGVTAHLPDGGQTSIFDAAAAYREEGVPLTILAGKEYGTGSSRDWAAKGPALLGVRVVIARSFERIHRSNLIGMGILPLQFAEGDSAGSLGLTGRETFDFTGLAAAIEESFAVGNTVGVRATAEDGSVIEFEAISRIDTPNEVEYYRNGGILQFVLRRLSR